MPSDAGVLAPVEIMRARVEDLDAAAVLFDAYRRFYRVPTDLAAARDFLARRLERDESVIFLARGGSARDVIGFAQIYRTFSSVRLAPVMVLNDLFVDERWRAVGAGRRLVEAAVTHAVSAGALRLDLATEHTNARALALYDSMDFVRETEFVHMGLALTAAPPAVDA